jgi:hypothetical protein
MTSLLEATANCRLSHRSPSPCGSPLSSESELSISTEAGPRTHLE